MSKQSNKILLEASAWEHFLSAFLWAFYFFVCACALFVIYFIRMLGLSRRTRNQKIIHLAHLFYVWVLSTLGGIKFQESFEGGKDTWKRLVEASGGRSIFVATHLSLLDRVVLARQLPFDARPVSSDHLGTIPILGLIHRECGTVLVDRASAQGKNSALSNIIEAARHGSILIFPAGTRDPEEGEELFQFKPGAFFASFQTGAPVVPVIIKGLSPVLRKGTGLVGRNLTVAVRYLKPIDPSGFETATEMMRHVEKIMRAEHAALVVSEAVSLGDGGGIESLDGDGTALPT